MLTNLGIIAASQAGSRAPATFTAGGTVLPSSNIGRLSFINGTAVLGQASSGPAGGESNWYSASVYTGATAGGNSIDAPWGHYSENGVTLKFGRNAAGTVSVARSTDGGQTWATALNTASTSDLLYAAAYGDVGGTARWITPVYGDNDVYLSTNNGSSWTIQSNVLGGTARNWTSAVRLGTAFGVFADITSYYTSDTGTTWTLRTLPGAPAASNADYRNFVAGSGVAMYLTGNAYTGATAYITTDLVNWTNAGTVTLTGPTPQNYLRLAYGNGYWVAMREGEDSNLETLTYAYSASNGSAWTQGTIISGSAVIVSGRWDIAYNSTDGGFYVVAGTRVWRAITI